MADSTETIERWFSNPNGFVYAHKIDVSHPTAKEGHELYPKRGDFEALVATHTTTDWPALRRSLDARAAKQDEASFAEATKDMPKATVARLLAKLAPVVPAGAPGNRDAGKNPPGEEGAE